eukprot:Pgem_evm1s10880
MYLGTGNAIATNMDDLWRPWKHSKEEDVMEIELDLSSSESELESKRINLEFERQDHFHYDVNNSSTSFNNYNDNDNIGSISTNIYSKCYTNSDPRTPELLYRDNNDFDNNNNKNSIISNNNNNANNNNDINRTYYNCHRRYSFNNYNNYHYFSTVHLEKRRHSLDFQRKQNISKSSTELSNNTTLTTKSHPKNFYNISNFHFVTNNTKLFKMNGSKRPRKREAITRVDNPCKHCGEITSCTWRPGPGGSASLCNTCGCYYRKYGGLNMSRKDLKVTPTTENLS